MYIYIYILINLYINGPPKSVGVRSEQMRYLNKSLHVNIYTCNYVCICICTYIYILINLDINGPPKSVGVRSEQMRYLN